MLTVPVPLPLASLVPAVELFGHGFRIPKPKRPGVFRLDYKSVASPARQGRVYVERPFAA
jgi:hypothetical protein